MALAAARLFEDLPGRPVEITEVIGQKDTRKESGGAGSAAHAEGYFVVELEVESRSKNAANREDIHVGDKDEIVFEVRAEVGIAASRIDVEVLGSRGVNGEVKPHGKAKGVEACTEVCGGRWQTEVQGLALGRSSHAG